MPHIQDLYPELYWYGELAPSFNEHGTYNCATDCVDAMPCFSSPCVQSIYRSHINDPQGMLRALVPYLEKSGMDKFIHARCVKF